MQDLLYVNNSNSEYNITLQTKRWCLFYITSNVLENWLWIRNTIINVFGFILVFEGKKKRISNFVPYLDCWLLQRKRKIVLNRK